MPYIDRSVDFDLWIADRIEEVLMMSDQVSAARPFGQKFSLWTKQPPADRMPHDQNAFGPVERGSVFITFLHVRRPDSLFKNELLAASLRRPIEIVLADRVLGVRELLIVIKVVFTAETGDSIGMSLNSEPPQSHIDIVNAIITSIAAAEVIPPTPDSMQ